MNHCRVQLTMLVGCLLISLGILGQPFTDEKQLAEENNLFIGITILGNPSLALSTISD